ncbi:nuclear transport factor 2 family protein, partial [bacterium]|nr:nuclear transport factor 2 family protein [bacterium]
GTLTVMLALCISEWRPKLSPNEMRSIVDHYIDAYNRMDVDAMLGCVHPQIEFKNITAGVVNSSTNGVAELKTLAQQSLSLFSERRQVIESFEAQGSWAVASINFRAVVASDLPNGLKKGQVLNLSGRSEFEFKDGVISKITDIS